MQLKTYSKMFYNNKDTKSLSVKVTLKDWAETLQPKERLI